MSKAQDHAGNELRPVVVQVLGRDADGWPKGLRPFRDTDEINTLHEDTEFIICWVSKSAGMRGKISNMAEMAAMADEFETQCAKFEHDYAKLRSDCAALEAENNAKTDELRKLNRERDPERVARMITEAVETKTAALESDLVRLKNVLAEAHNEVRELKESKKRLKEANERLKQRK